MSFKTAIPHLEQALSHAKAGNAAKAMHHVGHSMIHLRGLTHGAGSSLKIPSMSSKGSADPLNGPSMASGADMNTKGPAMPDADSDDPTMIDPNTTKGNAKNLRARLMGLKK